MPHKTKKIIFWIILFFTIFSAFPVYAADELCFKPQIEIPGMDKIFEVCPEGATYGYEITGLSIARFIIVIYKYSIGVVGILSAIVLMWAGVLWLTAGGSQTRVTDAQAWIKGSLAGLALTLCSFLILSTANPALTVLKAISLDKVPALSTEEDTSPHLTKEDFLKALPPPGCEDPAISSGSVKGVKITSSAISSGIVKGEKVTSDTPLWCPAPRYGCGNLNFCYKGKVDRKTLVNINRENYPGLTCDNPVCDLKSETFEALKKAAATAKTFKVKGKGYENKEWQILVKSALRSLIKQQTLWNDKLKKKEIDGDELKACRVLSYPTNCAPHIQGIAVDVCLCETKVGKDGKKMIDPACPNKGCRDVTISDGKPDPVLTQALKTIMYSAGFVRYREEWWHFEYPVDPNLPNRVRN